MKKSLLLLLSLFAVSMASAAYAKSPQEDQNYTTLEDTTFYPYSVQEPTLPYRDLERNGFPGSLSSTDRGNQTESSRQRQQGTSIGLFPTQQLENKEYPAFQQQLEDQETLLLQQQQLDEQENLSQQQPEGFSKQQAEGFGKQQAEGFGKQQSDLSGKQRQSDLSGKQQRYQTKGKDDRRQIKPLPKKGQKETEEEEASAVERAMAENPVPAEKVKPQPYGMKKLTQFGYSFFKSPTPPKSASEQTASEPSSKTAVPQTGADVVNRFAPLTDVPVGPDYVIGAGDRLVVTVWGSIDGTFNLEVNRGGEVALPKVGAVKVAGQRFDQLPNLLTLALSRVYKNFHLNVNIGKLRLIKVYLVGEVQSPGDYNVSSLSTVINALSAAGGPNKNGSLRNIQINRNGKLAETIDLYDFFLKGDKGRDIRLQPGDTILVPVIGPVAGVSGNVRRPGIYELKGERTLKELMALAGGVNPSGYLQRVLLYRVHAHDKKVVTDFNLDANGGKSVEELAGGITLQDMDLVKVLPIDSALRGYVRLLGHVLRPGDYALKPGMRVSALLEGDNLLPEYYQGAGQITRLCPPDQHPEVLFFDLSRALKGESGSNPELKEFDRVKIFARKEMEEIPYVKVNGEVQKPGQVRYFENMTVRDLLMQVGNVKLTAYLKNAEITRLKRTGDAVTSYSIAVDLDKALQGGADNLKIEPFDELTVRRVPNWAESTERYVTLTGEFVFSGTYPIYKGERLSSVIARAGGFTDRAYLKGAKFTRELARQLQQKRMDEALDKAQENIIKMQTKIAQTAASPEEAASSKSTLEGLMQSVELLKTKKAEGRMIVEIASLVTLKGSVYDVELQGGDELSVPTDPGGVNVIGDVYNQNTIVTQQGRNVDWYLSQVGGPTGDADTGSIYVVKVDGSVISQENSSNFLFYNSFWRKPLDSGDTIIVPRQYEKTAWLRNIKDVAAIIGNVAVTAGVLVAAGLF